MEPYAVETAFAASLGDLEVLQYLQDIPTNKWIVSNCNTDSEVFDFLAFVNTLLLWYKNFKTFRRTHTMGFPMDEWVLNASIVRGLDLDILKWLQNHNCPWSDYTFMFAAGHRTLEVLKWLRLKGCPWSERTFAYAIWSKRDFEILLWLRFRGCPWDECSLLIALTYYEDNVLLIQWLLREQCPCTSFELEFAIDRCNVSTLQMLADAKCIFRSKHFHHAILADKSIDVLKVLRRAKCPLDSIAFCCAIWRGDMEVLHWLKEKGCPWNAEVFTAAVEKGNREIIRWLYKEGCPMDKKTINAVMQKYVLNDDE
jgi:hypothetical protein